MEQHKKSDGICTLNRFEYELAVHKRRSHGLKHQQRGEKKEREKGNVMQMPTTKELNKEEKSFSSSQHQVML